MVGKQESIDYLVMFNLFFGKRVIEEDIRIKTFGLILILTGGVFSVECYIT